MRRLNLNKSNGQIIEAELLKLNLDYLDKIMELQYEIFDELENKELYAVSTKDEFKEYMLEKGIILGIVEKNTKSLIAMGVYGHLKYDKNNYGYDIELSYENLIKVCQVESTVVKKCYRGNGLQKLLCKEIENIAIKNKTPIIMATASPLNEYSLNTFKSLGYEIVKEKLKYGGLRRYVLLKKLEL
ncbi:hypothetical protein JCM1393_26810 [Clostridium carnis]